MPETPTRAAARWTPAGMPCPYDLVSWYPDDSGPDALVYVWPAGPCAAVLEAELVRPFGDLFDSHAVDALTVDAMLSGLHARPAGVLDLRGCAWRPYLDGHPARHDRTTAPLAADLTPIDAVVLRDAAARDLSALAARIEGLFVVVARGLRALVHGVETGRVQRDGLGGPVGTSARPSADAVRADVADVWQDLQRGVPAADALAGYDDAADGWAVRPEFGDGLRALVVSTLASRDVLLADVLAVEARWVALDGRVRNPSRPGIADSSTLRDTLGDPSRRLAYIDAVLCVAHFNAGGWPAVAAAFRADWKASGRTDAMPYQGGDGEDMGRKVRAFQKRRERGG